MWLTIASLKEYQKKRFTVKADIHPKYEAVKVTCSCGNIFETRSTLCHDLTTEICSACHPFYTGQQKIVDTAGRVDKFKKRFGAVGTRKKSS